MFNPYAIDLKAKKEGVWKEFNGSKFKIMPMMGIAFAKKMQALSGDLKGSTEEDLQKEDPEKLNELYCQALVGTVLVDWKDVGTEDEILEFSEETALYALQADDSFRDFVVSSGGNMATFYKQKVEKTVKK